MAVATSPETAFRRVANHAESIRNDDAHRVETMSVGDMWAQGDIGFASLAEIPSKAILILRPAAQLSPGNTQGSRHLVADLSAVKLYSLADPTPLDGPIIDAPNGVTVTHPEHGDVTLPPGVYGVIYQRAFSDELRRVLD